MSATRPKKTKARKPRRTATKRATAAAQPETPPPPRALTLKEDRFVQEFLVDLNATQAAIRAGYSSRSAKEIGYENLTKPHIADRIQAAMDERSTRTRITQDRVLQELATVAFSEMGKFAEWGANGVTLLQSDDLTEDERRCVAEVSETTSKDGGSIKFKLHDKVQALTLLGKHLGLFPERREISGRNGGPVPIEGTVRHVWQVGDRRIVWN